MRSHYDFDAFTIVGLLTILLTVVFIIGGMFG